MRVLVALGGNALLQRGQAPRLSLQRANVELAASALARVARQHRIVVTHGNGPQVGWLALQSEASGARAPLDLLDAQTEGMIGYWLVQALQNDLPENEVAALLTQVEVDPQDPAFALPTKPIGPLYDEARALALAAERGWQVGRDGEGWRRVVASPEPQRAVEARTLRRLVEAGVLVVCAGGGGIPVVRAPGGRLQGVEAVIDKDRTSALLAETLDADALVLLSDVDAVYQGWGTSRAAPLGELSSEELRKHSFEPGSMGPKVEAACRFVERTGRFAAIGALEQISGILAGRCGTRIRSRAKASL